MNNTQTEPNDYLVNQRFTRPDENNANIYESGTHVYAHSETEALTIARKRNAHLTILAQWVHGFYSPEGRFFNGNGLECCTFCGAVLDCCSAVEADGSCREHGHRRNEHRNCPAFDNDSQ